MTTNPFSSLVREPEPVVAQLGAERRRAKNTLSVLASLLSLQSREVADPVSRAGFSAAEARIRVVITLYDRLARSGAGAQLDVADALQEIANHAVRHQARTNVALQVLVDPLHMDLELAIPIALLAHELMSDALSCAFVGRSAGRLELTLRVPGAGSDAMLIVGDDGVARSPLVPEASAGGRAKLVDVLLRQLRARLSLESVSGTRLAVRFSLAQ